MEIPNSVKTIGDLSFKGCKDLTSVTIPNSVISIGEEAFSECGNLKSITIPASVTSIGNKAFSKCTALKSIEVPDLDFLSHFSECTNLESLTVTGELGQLTKKMLEGCTNFKNISFTGSVSSIGEYAFQGFANLSSISLPDGITSIGNLAFAGCIRLTEITIPKTVTLIGESAFSMCSNLQSVEMPNCIAEIEIGTFYMCSRLTSVVIPESVESIGASAFKECSGLTSVEIPKSVTSIGGSAFSGCSNLKTIKCLASELSESNENLFDASVYEKARLIAHPKAKEIAPWNKFNDISLLGDANKKGGVDISDVTTIANVAVGFEVDDFDAELADVNGNGKITVSDAVAVVEIVLDLPHEVSASMSKIRGCNSEGTVLDGTLILSDNLDITMESEFDLVALQADIYMPEGMTLDGVSAGVGASAHTAMHRQVGDGVYRVVLYNFNGVKLDANGQPLLSLQVSGDSDDAPILANIVASDAKGTGHQLASANGSTAAVGSIYADDISVTVQGGELTVNGAEGETVSIYTTDGHFVKKCQVGNGSISLTPGIYIVTVGDRSIKTMVK